MKKYSNVISEFKITTVFVNIVFIGIAIIRVITYKVIDDLSSFFVMVIGLPFCALLMDFIIFLLRKQFYTTFYNETEISQKLMFKRKNISLIEIKHIVVVGNVLVLSKEIIDLSLVPKNVSKAIRYLDNNVLILLGKSNSILNSLSSLNSVQMDLVKPAKQTMIRISKYFNL